MGSLLSGVSNVLHARLRFAFEFVHVSLVCRRVFLVFPMSHCSFCMYTVALDGGLKRESVLLFYLSMFNVTCFELVFIFMSSVALSFVCGSFGDQRFMADVSAQFSC